MAAGQDRHARFLERVAADDALGFYLSLSLGFFESPLLGFQTRRLGFRVSSLGLFSFSVGGLGGAPGDHGQPGQGGAGGAGGAPFEW